MKNVLVTGAAGGMGRAVCRLLTDSGYEVWGLDIAPGEAACPWHYIQTDLSDTGAVKNACQQVQKEAGALYALVHMAGIYDLNSLVEMSEEAFRQIFEVNLFAAYRVNREFLPLLQPGGRIVLTTSELAPLEPLPFTGIYGITKTALEKYAFSLRMELQLLGYRVCVLRPGAVKTGLLFVSTKRLGDFCENTKLYACNAQRFRKIVDSVEAKNISPEKVASRVLKILRVKNPHYVYNVNRNPLLRLLNFLPDRMQTAVIRQILK